MRGMKGMWFGRSQFEKQGHYVALPFTLKTVSLKAKEEEELWKLKYFTMEKYNFQKIL